YAVVTHLAIAPNGDVVAAGYTTSKTFPVRHALQENPGGGNDAFVIRFDRDLQQIRFATYLGGAGYDSFRTLALDGEGNAYIAMATPDRNFLGTNAFDFGVPAIFSGTTVIVKLSPAG